jgi:tetratricopeptide (TPR) repeat protein
MVLATQVDYFIDLAEQAHPHLNGGRQYAFWLQRLEAEKENLMAAMCWCVEQNDAERALQLGGAVWRLWYVRRVLGEARVWLDALLRVVPGSSRTAIRARALNGAGVLAVQQGDYDRAQSMYEESLEIFRELGDKDRIAIAFNNLGVLALFRQELVAARDYLEQSLTIRRESGDDVRCAIVLSNLALLQESQGEYLEAYGYYADSSACYRRVADTIGLAASLSDGGHAALAQGEVETARRLCEESLELARNSGNQHLIAASCLELGFVRLQVRETSAARALFRECLTTNRGPGHADERSTIPRGLAGLAAVEVADGRPERALTLMAAAGHVRAQFIARFSSQRDASIETASGSRMDIAPRVPDRWTSPFDQQSIGLFVAAARAMLHERIADEAWRRGAGLSLTESMALAMEVRTEANRAPSAAWRVGVGEVPLSISLEAPFNERLRGFGSFVLTGVDAHRAWASRLAVACRAG